MSHGRVFLLLFAVASLLRAPVLLSSSGTSPVNAAEPLPLPVLPDPVENVEALLNKQPGALMDVIAHPTGARFHDMPQAGADVAETSYVRSVLTDEQRQRYRQLFLQAEEAISKRDDATYAALAKQLKDYPLYPYLQHQWLKKHLDDELQVKQFLLQYASSRYADLLKSHWLYHLAKRKQWSAFLRNYSGSHDTSLQCYFHRAQYQTGEQQQALAGAAKLWAVGKSQPKACDPLFAKLKQSPLFNAELFWQRFFAAMNKNNARLAKYVKKLMPSADQRTASLWLKLHRNPQKHLPELLKQNTTPLAASMFVHAVNHLASRDIHQAVETWDANRQRFDIDESQLRKTDTRLALKLAYANEPDAYERLATLQDADNNSKSWRIRVALAEQNWPRVIESIRNLSAAEQEREKWQYWLARAYEETGDDEQSEELYNKLSDKRDFYAYLAADRIGRDYQLADRPLQVPLQHIKAIGSREEFQAAFELLALDREALARQQWWHAIRKLDTTEIPAAAKLAQQWRWHHIAIFTIAKVKYWDDVELRFPLSHHDEIHKYAMVQELEPSILFGITRRESAFNEEARSPVGARGLMQLMPKTARYVASKMGERWHGVKDLLQPDKNLKYGAWYYQYLLQKFDGNFAAALAAYNAGPHRVKKWLPEESMPADIWIETIPFRETRNYVTSVLVYAMIYKQRLQSGELSLSDFAADVHPLTELAAR